MSFFQKLWSFFTNKPLSHISSTQQNNKHTKIYIKINNTFTSCTSLHKKSLAHVIKSYSNTIQKAQIVNEINLKIIGKGKKGKKGKKGLMKMFFLGAVLKSKIEMLLKILSFHLQIKFFAIALINMVINLARFWIDLKKQPQKVSR